MCEIEVARPEFDSIELEPARRAGVDSASQVIPEEGQAVGRISRFDEHRFVGTRDDMVVYDCDDDGLREILEQRITEDDLVSRNLLQTYGPDALAEARNRGFTPA